MSTFCVVVTYDSMVKRDSACARCRAETLSTCLCRQANAVSELIPVKPDGIINGRHRYGPRRLQFDLFRLSALIWSRALLRRGANYKREDEHRPLRIIPRFMRDSFSLARFVR